MVRTSRINITLQMCIIIKIITITNLFKVQISNTVQWTLYIICFYCGFYLVNCFVLIEVLFYCFDVILSYFYIYIYITQELNLYAVCLILNVSKILHGWKTVATSQLWFYEHAQFIWYLWTAPPASLHWRHMFPHSWRFLIP